MPEAAPVAGTGESTYRESREPMRTVKITNSKDGQQFYVNVPETYQELVSQVGNDMVLELAVEGWIARAKVAGRSKSLPPEWKPESRLKKKVERVLQKTRRTYFSLNPEEQREFLKGVTEIARK